MSKVKPIYIKKAVIEIPLVDESGKTVHTIKFNKTDNNIERVESMRNQVLKDINALTEKSEDELTLDEVKKAIRNMIDGLIGEGTFNKLYELSPALDIVVYYFVEICKIIGQETQSNLAESRGR